MRALQDRGWEIHPQVAVSFFRVDLGVVHPEFPGRYLAGVECDGATYHRSATARDRDRLRELVLSGLGWRIRRIWSTEWWMDAAAAAEKIHTRLTADLASDHASRADTPQAEAAAATDVTEAAEAPRPAEDDATERSEEVTAERTADERSVIDEEPLIRSPEPANDRSRSKNRRFTRAGRNLRKGNLRPRSPRIEKPTRVPSPCQIATDSMTSPSAATSAI
jgi:very-short-patch-repair endonuclease